MSNLEVVFVLNVVLWGYLGFRFFRAVAHHRVTDGDSIRLWILVFLCCSVAVLTVPFIEQDIDGRFDSRPVAAFARSLLMLAAADIYFRSMRAVYAYPTWVRNSFPVINLSAVTICLAIFWWFATFSDLTNNEIGYLLKIVRDVVIGLWAVVIFWPAGMYLLRKEQFRPMKVHRMINLIFYGAVLLFCISGTARSLSAFLFPEVEPGLARVELFSTFLCMATMLLILVPIHWLAPLFYPMRLRIYLRLRKLSVKVSGSRGTASLPHSMSLRLTDPEELELGIYQNTIAVLDGYSLSDNIVLKQRIHQLVQAQPSFEKLVEAMVKLPV